MTFLAVISHSVSITSPISLLERLWMVLVEFTLVPSTILLVPVSDSAFCQVVRRQFERNPVTSHDLNPVPSQSPGHGGQHCFARVEFDCKHSSPEFFDNFAHYFDRVFF